MIDEKIDYKKVRRGIKEITLPFVPFCISIGLALGLIPLSSVTNAAWIFIIGVGSLWLGLPIMKYYDKKENNHSFSNVKENKK